MVRKRYTGRNKGFGRGIFIFLIIVVMAIGAGYVSTNYIISPYLLGQKNDKGISILKTIKEMNNKKIKQKEDTSSQIVSESPQPSDKPTQVENPKTVESNNDVGKTLQTIKLYCVQYGNFKERKGADDLVAKLKASNIEVAVISNDGSYKVIGNPYMKEDKAREALQAVKAIAGEDIFLTTMEGQME